MELESIKNPPLQECIIEQEIEFHTGDLLRSMVLLMAIYCAIFRLPPKILLLVTSSVMANTTRVSSIMPISSPTTLIKVIR